MEERRRKQPLCPLPGQLCQGTQDKTGTGSGVRKALCSDWQAYHPERVVEKNLASELSIPERRMLVDMEGAELPVATQAMLLGLNRTSLYYKPVPPSEEDLNIKLHIDNIYTAHPEFGYRRICWWLNNRDNILINHKAVLNHMREMGIQAIYPRQNTSKPEPGNKIYPYLLKGLQIDHPDHVWSIDITYIPIRTDWLYLVAIIDWYSRYVLHWEISDSMEIEFVLDTSRNALEKSVPEIMNSDYAEEKTMPKNPYPFFAYTSYASTSGIRSSMEDVSLTYCGK